MPLTVLRAVHRTSVIELHLSLTLQRLSNMQQETAYGTVGDDVVTLINLTTSSSRNITCIEQRTDLGRPGEGP
jgi:hypothetical protein